jgi:hypothetical protein
MRSNHSRRAAALGLGFGLILVPILAPSLAVADSTTAPVRPFILPDLSGLSVVGVDFQYTSFSEEVLGVDSNFTSLTFDLAAEIAVAPHWMILGRLPMGYVGLTLDPEPPADDDCCGFALGNATVGIRGLDSNLARGSTWLVSGGELTVSLPTAPDRGDGSPDDNDAATAATINAFAHLTDSPGRYLIDTTTIRLIGSAAAYDERFFLQGGVGLHAFIYDDDRSEDGDFLFHLGLAGGIRATPEIAAVLEVATNILLDNDGDGSGDVADNDEDVVTSVNLGARYGGEAATVGARLYFPLDDTFRDLDMFGIGIDAGARF